MTRWVQAWQKILQGHSYMRWHDSGDLIGPTHAVAVFNVATHTPWVRHWLPTRDRGAIDSAMHIANGVPPNLCVRISCNLIDEEVTTINTGPICYSVTRTSGPLHEFACPVTFDGEKDCSGCRMCWDKKVPVVTYKLH